MDKPSNWFLRALHVLKTAFSRRRSRATPGSLQRTAVKAAGIVHQNLDAEAELTAWFQSSRTCPDCGGSAFFEGPRGGISQNIRCAKAVCGSEFNVAQHDGHLLFAQRIRCEQRPQPTLH